MTSRPPGHLAVVREQRRPPPRRPRNGHHADCPYPNTTAATCHICAAIRKGATEEDQ